MCIVVSVCNGDHHACTGVSVKQEGRDKMGIIRLQRGLSSRARRPIAVAAVDQHNAYPRACIFVVYVVSRHIYGEGACQARECPGNRGLNESGTYILCENKK